MMSLARRISLAAGIIVVICGMAVERLLAVDQRLIVSIIVVGIAVVVVAAVNWRGIFPSLPKRRPKRQHQLLEQTPESEDALVGRLFGGPVGRQDMLLDETPLPVAVGRRCRQCRSTEVFIEYDRGCQLARCAVCGWREQHPEDIADQIVARVISSRRDGASAVDSPTVASMTESPRPLSRHKASRPIERFVNPRLAGVLRRNGIKTYGALVKTGNRNLQRIPGVGRESMAEIKQAIDGH